MKRAEGDTGAISGRCFGPGDKDSRLAGCAMDGCTRRGVGEDGSRGRDIWCMPDASRLLSTGAAPCAGFRIEGTAIGGSCVGANRGSTGPEGCQDAGRRRPEASGSGDRLSAGAFLFLLAGLLIVSVGAVAAGPDANRASLDESEKERTWDMGTLASRWLDNPGSLGHGRAPPLSRSVGFSGCEREGEAVERWWVVI